MLFPYPNIKGVRLGALRRIENLFFDALFLFSFFNRNNVTNGITLREDGADTENTFGYVSGYIDTASIATFEGANDVFANTWYNQGTGEDIVQTTANAQMQMVDSGSLKTLQCYHSALVTNLKASVDFSVFGNDITMFFVLNNASIASLQCIFEAVLTSNYNINLEIRADRLDVLWNSPVGTYDKSFLAIIPASTTYVLALKRQYNSVTGYYELYVWINETQEVSDTGVNTGAPQSGVGTGVIGLGSRTDNNAPYRGKIFEAIIYPDMALGDSKIESIITQLKTDYSIT